MNYHALVMTLYEHHKTWRGVAEACGGDFTRAYYWRIAKGKIRNLGGRGERGINNAYKQLKRELQPVTERRRQARKNISFSLPIYRRLLEIKLSNGETWNELMELLLSQWEDNHGR